MAWQRARTGDFFIEIDIFSVARKLFYDAIEFVGQYRRRRFAGDLLIVFGKVGVGIGIGDRVPQCANPLRRRARRRDKGRGGNSERPIDLQQPSIFIGPGKGFELREMSEAWVRAGFGDLQDRVNVDQFLFDPLGIALQQRGDSVYSGVQFPAHDRLIHLRSRVAGDEFGFLQVQKIREQSG